MGSPREKRTISIEVLGRSITMTAPAAYIIPKLIARAGLGSYEPETVACALALCERQQGVFLDVGANVGIYSIVVAAALGRECHAFEPTPEMAEVIRVTAERHGLPIEVHELALSNYSGTATLYLSAKSDSSNSLNRRFRPHLGTMEVEVGRLDDLRIPAPAIMKIDTESTEPDVLEGAFHVVQTLRPPIICEALPGRTESRLNEFLSSHEYVAYHITPDLAWTERTEVVPDASRDYNWLFAPRVLDQDILQRVAYWRQRIIGTP